MGHSRGTLSGLAAAAGSTAWNVARDPRVKAVMGMASGGTLTVTLQPNLPAIEIPTLLVAGGRDLNSPRSINEALFKQIACPAGEPGCANPTAEKAFVVVPDAHHRSFISTFLRPDPGHRSDRADVCGPSRTTSIGPDLRAERDQRVSH
jgi:predicted dienelactone hydrolase